MFVMTKTGHPTTSRTASNVEKVTEMGRNDCQSNVW
jgi:hypothetical protein